MENKIKKIPDLPNEIREAIKNRNFAVFIGAGVSMIIGCKGWDKLANNLVELCFKTKNKNNMPLINFKEKETICNYTDNKKKISICYYLLENEGLKEEFFKELRKSLECNDGLIKSQNIYEEIFALRGLFITTNADEHFHGKFLKQNIVYKKDELRPNNIDNSKLYHIHGFIEDRDSLVFTVPEYIKRYKEKEFKNFLTEIFSSHVVLFVGYGLAEFELLDYIITRFDSKNDKELKRFTLQPFYRGEENILSFEQSYYDSMGIKLLAYEKDELGYDQLYEVIKSWNKRIHIPPHPYDLFKEIDYSIENFDSTKVDRILKLTRCAS